MAATICVAVRESTTRKAAESAARAREWADLVEIRADFIEDLDLDLLFRAKPCPMVFTLRSREEGGAYVGSERLRLETLLRAAQGGADYIDIEFSAAWQPILSSVPREKVVLSYHDFDGTPPDLDSKMEAMAASGAGVLKVAVRARSLADCLRISGLLDRASARNMRVAAMAMGREGIPSRILGSLWGSFMTFASLPGGEPTADGQVPADVLVREYRVRGISRQTRLYGVVGRPLGHSLSPHIHNAAFAARGEDAVLIPLEAATFDDFLRFHASFPLQGAAVTLPYKGEAHALAQSLSLAADQTRAVNTLAMKKTGWHGENTDVDGFLRPLKRRVHLGKIRAVVLGAGGAARAAVYGLRSQGADVCVVSRDSRKASRLATVFQAEQESWERLGSLQWDLLVNATPVGMYPDTGPSPVPESLLTGEWVYDLIYNPAETRLLADAKRRGCKTIAGSEMFLGQAWKQQVLWCGTAPPELVMEAALEDALSLPRPDSGKGGDPP